MGARCGTADSNPHNRRTYPELRDHIEPIIRLVPPAGHYNITLRSMSFYNGSVIKLGHYSAAARGGVWAGVHGYSSTDHALPSRNSVFWETSCAASTALKRFYPTCNPGGVGHGWVKRLFIDKDYITGRANPEENENPDDYSFIPATVEDNVYLMKASPSYVKMLSSLPENIRRAHRYGDWNALAGTYFPEFTPEKHVVRPFIIPDHWMRYRAFDYGLDMLACLWFAQDESGRSYMYRELKVPNLIVSGAARAILSRTPPEERIGITFAPPDMWSRQKDTGRTMAEIFMTSGVPIARADSSRVQGWLQVKEALADRADGRPSLLFFELHRDHPRPKQSGPTTGTPTTAQPSPTNSRTPATPFATTAPQEPSKQTAPPPPPARTTTRTL